MRRLTLLAILAVLLAATTAHAGWWKTYGGWRGDCIQITSDSNYIISGVNDDAHLWLIKTDTAGTILWSKTCGTTGGDYTRWLEETSDGGYIIAAWIPSLVKTDEQGDTLWTHDYGMKSYCVQEASDGGYVTIGGNNGFGHDEYLVVLKSNSQGDSMWSKTYTEPGHNWNVGYSIQRTDDDGYIITGLTGYVDSEYNDWFQLWLLKIDSSGNKLWSQTYGPDEWFEYKTGHSVRQTSDGGYIITGAEGLGMGVLLLKTDANGDSLWAKVYSTPTGGRGLSVQETSDGGYIITGATTTLTLLSTPLLSDLWLLKTDGTGDTLWTRRHIPGGSIGRCVQPTSDKGYIVTGSSLFSSGGSSGLVLLKTDSLGLLAITEDDSGGPEIGWSLVTSLGQRISLRYWDSPQGFKADVFDASGRKVDEIRSLSSSGEVVWGEGRPSGVYFITPFKTNGLTTTRVVLVH